MSTPLGKAQLSNHRLRQPADLPHDIHFTHICLEHRVAASVQRRRENRAE